MKTEHSKLLALVDALREKGVRVYHGQLDGQAIVLELGPAIGPELPATESPDAELCLCGHPLYAHQSGPCIHGCDIEKCAGPEEKPS